MIEHVGVDGDREPSRVDSLEAFDDAFASAMRSCGPRLIEAVL